MMETPMLRKAEGADAPEVMRLYSACVGAEDCCWNEYYPGLEEIDADIRMGTLYLWEQNGRLAGAVSLLWDDDIEHLGMPFTPCAKPCVLCRLCVDPGLRHGGMGAALLRASEQTALSLGYDAMHLLVDERQRAAQALYRRTAYRDAGQTAMYGNRYNVMEKSLKGIG